MVATITVVTANGNLSFVFPGEVQELSVDGKPVYDKEMPERLERVARSILEILDVPVPGTNEVLGRDVTSLGLQVRHRNRLHAVGIRTVADLIKRSEADLLGIVYIGQGSVNSVKRALAKHGLKLRDG